METQTEIFAPTSEEAPLHEAAPMVSPFGAPDPCPPPGGATSAYQMNSTTTAVLTYYQYWHMKMHGHHPGAIA